jgi:hypothetical protein
MAGDRKGNTVVLGRPEATRAALARCLATAVAVCSVRLDEGEGGDWAYWADMGHMGQKPNGPDPEMG